MPNLSDAQWSSVVEQTSDKVLAVSIPSKHIEPGKTISMRDGDYEVGPRSMAIQMLKQRFGAAAREDAWIVDFDAASVSLHEQEKVAGGAW